MCTVRNLSSCPAFCFSSSTATLPQTTRHPTTWTLCSSLKNHPAASRLKKQPSCPRCLPLPPSPDWIAPVWRRPTQTAPAASCLRCDQSGEAISCGARVLFNLHFSFCSAFICFCSTSWLVFRPEELHVGSCGWVEVLVL